MSIIEDKFKALLAGGLNLGKTVGGEEPLPDDGTRQDYEFGAIYFHPRVGEAFECHGLILDTYRDLGEQASALGYPVSDEEDDPDVEFGRMSSFEGGTLNFDPQTGEVTPFFEDVPVSPEIVLKIAEGFSVKLAQGAEISIDDLAALLGLPEGDAFTELVRAFLPEVTFLRLFDSVSPELLADMVNEAVKLDPEYVPPLFENYLSVVCPDDFDPQPLADALLQFPKIVELAIVRRESDDPNVAGTPNPLFDQQKHLRAINVRAAWDRGADGSGSRFIDVEQGWITRHDDLPPLRLLFGHNRFDSSGHGTAVLGVVIGMDNTTGIVGIAPGADASVVSYFNPTQLRRPTRQTRAIESAIALAASRLGAGDVLLLEIESPTPFDGGPTHDDTGSVVRMPVEIDQPIYDIVRLTTGRRIIVVEAAGNGNANLDEHRPGGNAILSRNGPGHRVDSGAIFVGGCTTDNQRWISPSLSPDGLRLKGSNFGSRLDCCAWAEKVVTTGDRDPPFRPNGYLEGPEPNFFSGTSSASAIVAGVCLLIQDLAAATTGRLDPLPMRNILSDVANGTPVADIGPLPDLKKIIRNHFP